MIVQGFDTFIKPEDKLRTIVLKAGPNMEKDILRHQKLRIPLSQI